MNYAHTDKIFDLLLRENGVKINNSARKWALIHEKYIFNPDALSFVPNEHIIVAIDKKFGKRILAPKCSNFDLLTSQATSCTMSLWWRLTMGARSGWWWRPGADCGQMTTTKAEMRVTLQVGRSRKRRRTKLAVQAVVLISSMAAAPTKTRLRNMW